MCVQLLIVVKQPGIVALVHSRIHVRLICLQATRLELGTVALDMVQPGDPVAGVRHHGLSRVKVNLAHQVAVHRKVAHKARQCAERDQFAVAHRREVGETGAALEFHKDWVNKK